jgi:sulfotransferase
MANIHFISGLPRSGSTLLAALLRQNPRFQAGMSGPLAGLFGALLGQMSARNEYSVFIDDTQRERIVHGLFDNFYADSPADVIFDTSRGWCGWMPAIARLFPEAKVIACVREMPWVLDSIERLVQRNVFSPSSIFNYSPGGTVYTRANGVVAPDGMVGGPYDALKQALKLALVHDGLARGLHECAKVLDRREVRDLCIYSLVPGCTVRRNPAPE